MEFLSEQARNPFGMRPPCPEFVPGYGDANADFHVIGDHPGVHGGRSSGIPFTDKPWSTAFFDAEVRAITAHVLFPVGQRATRHVLEQYTARSVGDTLDMNALHAREIRGAGWLVMPIADPREWEDGDAETLVEGLQTLLESDYRQASDLGRFIAGENPYFVR